MSTNLDVALAFTSAEEGGLVDNPDDPGGLTNRGVTQETFNTYLRRHGYPLASVATMTEEEYRQLCHELFWVPAGCEELPTPVWLPQFDAAVNMGVPHAVMLFQAAVGATVDGVMGPATLKGVDERPPLALAYGIVDLRRGYHIKDTVARPRAARYLKGWLARCDRLDRMIGSIT